MKGLRLKLKASLEAARLLGEMEPRYWLFALPSAALSAVISVLSVYFSKIVLDSLTGGADYSRILREILGFAAALLAARAALSALENRVGLCGESFPAKFRLVVGKIVMGLRYEHTETAGARTVIQLASNVTRITDAQSIARGILADVLSAISLAVIVARLGPVFAVLVAGLLAVKIWLAIRNFGFYKKRRSLYAENDRIDGYLYGVRNSPGGAKELRVNHLRAWFTSKIREQRDGMLALQYGDFSRFNRYNALTAAFAAAQSFATLVLLAGRYLSGTVSIGDFAMYFGAVAALTATVSAIADKVEQYNQRMVNLEDFDKLRRLRDGETLCDHPTHGLSTAFTKEKAVITFEDVSFCYPGTRRMILSNINLTVRDKEKLVLVGPNGAGKSTLIKLVCKFYKPTAGRILLNGVDVWAIPDEEYYPMVSAVFQDFANFAFTIMENMTLGKESDKGFAEKCIGDAGLSAFIASLPGGGDTYVTRKFDANGIEPSGGEGQKLAIARLLYKCAPLAMLDEPTASLDPRAEAEIYDSFFKLSRNKTTIFVSHRLAASTMADNIAVLDGDGRIAEYGCHRELMHKGGLYAQMFIRQSHSYSVQ